MCTYNHALVPAAASDHTDRQSAFRAEYKKTIGGLPGLLTVLQQRAESLVALAKSTLAQAQVVQHDPDPDPDPTRHRPHSRPKPQP